MSLFMSYVPMCFVCVAHRLMSESARCPESRVNVQATSES